MKRHFERPARLSILFIIASLSLVISPLHHFVGAQATGESRPPISASGIIWGNSLNLLISIHVLEFDPNLCGVRFDTSLLRSDDLSTIYGAIKEKIVYKDGKRPIGILYPKDGPYIRLTQDMKKSETVPLRFREESLVRIICDFRVSGLDFQYSCVDTKIKELADSTISLVVFADDNVIDSLRSVLAKQNYVKFVGRFGVSSEGGFRSVAPHRSKTMQVDLAQGEPGRDEADEHFVYPHENQDIYQTIIIALEENEDPLDEDDEIGVFTPGEGGVLAGVANFQERSGRAEVPLRRQRSAMAVRRLYRHRLCPYPGALDPPL